LELLKANDTQLNGGGTKTQTAVLTGKCKIAAGDYVIVAELKNGQEMSAPSGEIFKTI
jgi:hypothetical protein